MKFIATTEFGIERIAAGRIDDIAGMTAAIPANCRGLVIVESSTDATEGSEIEDAAMKLEAIPEINIVLPVEAECAADLSEIVTVGTALAHELIPESKTFAVDARKRGDHDFTSVDVKLALGGAISRDVNLSSPDHTLCIEIINEAAYFAVISGRRNTQRLPDIANSVAAKIAVIQMFYPSESDVTEEMGYRIGRAAQAFGVGELILAHCGEAAAQDFARFCRGACEGRATRLKKAKRIRTESTSEVPIKVSDLFQIVRQKRDEPIIIASAAGKPIRECYHKVAESFSGAPRVNLLVGARQGIPKGIFRFADIVINFTPGITFATEHGIPAAVTGLIACVQLDNEERRGNGTT